MISERTLVIVKPDGVQRSLVGEIIQRFERVGLKLVGMKMVSPDKDHIEKHYLTDSNWKEIVGKKNIDGYKNAGMTPPTEDPAEAGQMILDTLIRYMSATPVIAMVWQGAHSVEVVRKLVGSTEPKTSDVGTIRGDYVLDSYILSGVNNRSIRNLVHASGSVDEAKKEIDLWFAEGEIFEYVNAQEAIMYAVNLDGAGE